MSTATHRHAPPGQHEHEFEPAPGLPEPLPAGERILWQGGPDWKRLALRAFHLRKLATYFAVILALRALFVFDDSGSLARAAVAVLWLLPLVAFALGTVLMLAWLSARTAVYTITTRRVVMRVGIVLTLTFNLPLKRIASASLREDRDGLGDLPLTLAGNDRIAWLNLWPHARPWKFARPEPALRCVPDARRVAQLLSAAWSQANGVDLAPTAAAPVAEHEAPRRPGAPQLAAT